MQLSKTIRRLRMVAFGLVAVAGPTYANWGPASPWAVANQTVYCNHSHSGNTFVRRARLTVTREELAQPCAPVGDIPGCVPLPPIFVDDAWTRNVSSSGTADILLAGYDQQVPPGSFLPWIATFNDVPLSGTRWFSKATGKKFYDLQAQCYVSNDML